MINRLTGNQFIKKLTLNVENTEVEYPDLTYVYGQEQPKRALEIATAGGHNMLMVGTSDTGKSMTAQMILGILPDLMAREILNVIHSLVGNIIDGKLSIKRPFLGPYHSCSMSTMVGVGTKPEPGQYY